MAGLPIYEPRFLWDRDEKGRRVGEAPELRMTVLWVPSDPAPRGGFAVVWGTMDEIRRANRDSWNTLLATRLPAVMKLPDMWVSAIRSCWEQFAPDQYDLVWTLTSESMGWSEDEEKLRAIGGHWLPVRQNLLLGMSKAADERLRDIAMDVRCRVQALCAEHGVALPSWWQGLPCARCGGTGNIGYTMTVRCPAC